MEKRLERMGGIRIGQFADEVEFLDEGKTKQRSLKWRDGMLDVPLQSGPSRANIALSRPEKLKLVVLGKILFT